jgi:hypothetical protein
MGHGSRKEMRTVGAVFFVLLTALGVWQLTKDHGTAGWILVGCAVYFGLGAALVPVILVPFYAVWMRFAFALGWVNARLLLSLFYGLLVTPMGLVARLFRRDGLDRRLDSAEESYWHGRGEPRSRESYEKQF